MDLHQLTWSVGDLVDDGYEDIPWIDVYRHEASGQFRYEFLLDLDNPFPTQVIVCYQ